jgi:hypothetical protein
MPTITKDGFVGWLLVVIGVCAMAAVMWMTGLHVLNDAAAAGLVVASSILLGKIGWKYKLMGSIALLCGLAHTIYSVVTVYGFMSTRIAHLQSHKNLVGYQKDELAWKRGVSVSRDVPKSERLSMRIELRLTSTELKNSLRFIPDMQAASLATLFTTSVERVQRGLVAFTSFVGQLIKVSCLFFGVALLTHRSADHTSGSSAGSGGSCTPRIIPSASQTSSPASPPPSAPADNPSSPAPGVMTSHHSMTEHNQSSPSYDAMTSHMSVHSKQRDAGSVSAGVKWTRPRLEHFLLHGASGLSQRDIAKMTGYTQPGISKAQRRLRLAAERRPARRNNQ